MKSRVCPFFQQGLCPDTELEPSSGRAVDVYVVLPYDSDGRYLRLIREVLAPAAGVDPGHIEIGKTIACRLESAPSHALLQHCGGKRLVHSIRHSGASSVYAIGRSAAEISYPAPAYFAPSPEDRGTSPSSLLRPFLLAIEECCHSPEIIRNPSIRTISIAVEDAMAVAMHVSGQMLYWAAWPGIVHVMQLDSAAVETIAEAVGKAVSFDLPGLWDAAPNAILQAEWQDLSARLLLPIRRIAQAEDLFGKWLPQFLEALEIIDPDLYSRAVELLDEDVTRIKLEDLIDGMGVVYDELESVIGQPPPVGDQGMAILTDRAIRIAGKEKK